MAQIHAMLARIANIAITARSKAALAEFARIEPPRCVRAERRAKGKPGVRLNQTRRWCPMSEIEDALQRFQIQTLEALLALADLEEAGLAHELLSAETSVDRRLAALNRSYEVPVEREIILENLADLDPPLRVQLD